MSMTSQGLQMRRRTLGEERAMVETRSMPGAPCLKHRGGGGKAEARRSLPGAPMLRRRAENERRGEVMKEFKGVTRGSRLGWGERGAAPGMERENDGDGVGNENEEECDSVERERERGAIYVTEAWFKAAERAREERGAAASRAGVRVFDFAGWEEAAVVAMGVVLRRAAESRPGDFFLPREVPGCFQGICGAWPAVRWREFFRAAGWDGETAGRLAGVSDFTTKQ